VKPANPAKLAELKEKREALKKRIADLDAEISRIERRLAEQQHREMLRLLQSRKITPQQLAELLEQQQKQEQQAKPADAPAPQSPPDMGSIPIAL